MRARVLGAALLASSIAFGCTPSRPPPATAPAVRGGGIPGDRPVVIIVRASWCASCLRTAPAVAWLRSEYEGRVSFVDLDLTDDATTTRSALTAERLGLRPFFEDNGGRIGVTILGRDRKAIRRLIGERFARSYRKALDEAFASFER